MNDKFSELLDVELLWHRDSKGYVLEDHGRFGLWIARRGGELVPVYPLRGGFAFKAFANTSTPKELVQFMNCYGFLSRVDPYPSSFLGIRSGKLYPERGAPEPCGEDVHDHLKSAGFFREMMQAQPGRALSREVADWIGDSGADGIGEIEMRFNKKGMLRPVLTVTSLMKGLFWQLVSSLRGGTHYRSCKDCGGLFQVGAGSARRLDAKFCSEEHKTQFHSRKRSVK